MEHKFKSYQPVIVRDEGGEVWRAAFFSHYFGNDKHDLYKYVCTNDRRYKQCLPAKGNRHLTGTTDSPEPPEPEFKLGDKVEVLSFGAWVRGIFLCKINNTCLYRVVTIAEVEEDKKERNNTKYYFKHCRHADW